jgi:hypothetical protein
MVVVTAITLLLSGTVAPKVIKQFRKSKVAKVKSNLSAIRTKLFVEVVSSGEFPNLYDETNTDLLKNYNIGDTPSFKGNAASSKVTYSRTDTGGWVYNREEGEIYANLPDGAYTLDVENEIWGGETVAISKITYSDNLDYGKLQFLNEDNEWEDMIDGEVYSSDTEIRYVPDSDYVSESTNAINVGTESGETAALSDWGTVSGNTAVMTLDDGTIITTTLSDGNLKVLNGTSSLGTGIGSTEIGSGLNKNQTLTIDVDGEDINKVIFTLDGLGGWFDESSSKATKVVISAFDESGVLIETQSSYRDSGSFTDDYTFEITEPVAYFELTTAKGKISSPGSGTYVVQNVSLIKSAQDQVNLTIENPDGTTEVITKDILLDETNSGDIITIIETEEEE